MADEHALTLSEYEQLAATTDRFDLNDRASRDQIRYGFFGEIGGLLAAVKKAHRDKFAPAESESAKEEIGDALWYLNAMIRRAGTTLELVGQATVTELQRLLHVEGSKRATEDTTFREIDGLLAFQQKQIPEPKDVLLYRLAAHTGAIFTDYNNEGGTLISPSQTRAFAELLCTLAMVAAKFGLSLSNVANENLKKITSRWPAADEPYIALFDADAVEYERLPRQLEIHFVERKIREKTFVAQQWNGVNIGDPLTDNRMKGDDYRYHDVFHLAYMAHLGWSPVIRALLKLKRKSQPELDENEDGARPIIIEEGIATWIFNHARERDEYKGVELGKLEYSLLKQVQDMVSGYQVELCPLWQWERAILDGFKVFRELRDSKAGTVSVDMVKHTISFRPEVSR